MQTHPHLPLSSFTVGRTTGLALGMLKGMRPRQWVKNILVFAALVFDGKLFQIEPVLAALGGFVVLCLLSSAVYLVNDVADAPADRKHPTKCNRPIARGLVPVPLALGVATAFSFTALALAFELNDWFGLIAIGYVLLTLAYTFKLKHIVIADVITLALGFVLRVGAGAVLAHALRFSPWMYAVVMLLALLMGFGKRRAELAELGQSTGTRAILRDYSLPLLDQLIGIVTAALITAYSLYTFSAPNLPVSHTMMATIPFVLYALFRYLWLVLVKGEGGAPDELAFKDRPMQLAFGLWLLASIAVIYGSPLVGI